MLVTKRMNGYIKQCNSLILTLFLMGALNANVAAAPDFPELTGRVVDGANIISLSAQKHIVQKLEAHENASTNQVVVVTVNDLQGYSIEEYGYLLGRHWAIGQADKNNGVLLLIAKSERKVRIEVGYGLEGLLTDAISSNIIHQVIRPQFKQKKFSAGVVQGVSAMIEALGGQYAIKQGRSKKSDSLSGFIWLIFLIIGIFSSFSGGGRGRRRGRSGHYYGGSYGGGYSSGSSGGFGGGGGSFGGGGASGGW